MYKYLRETQDNTFQAPLTLWNNEKVIPTGIFGHKHEYIVACAELKDVSSTYSVLEGISQINDVGVAEPPSQFDMYINDRFWSVNVERWQPSVIYTAFNMPDNLKQFGFFICVTWCSAGELTFSTRN